MRWLIFTLFATSALAAEPPLVLGHRGLAWDHAENPHPENSERSVRAALEAGADGVEIDVFMTQDGVVVLAHEDALHGWHRTRQRRSPCKKYILDSDWDAIRRCRLRPGPPDAPDAPLARLEQIMDLPGLDLLVIDVKSDQAGADLPATMAAIARIVHGFDAADRVVVMVYTLSGIGLARQHGLRACHKRHFLEGRGFTAQASADELKQLAVWGQCASTTIVKPPLMKALNGAGVRQLPYLLGHGIRERSLQRIWERFQSYGVHAVITDRVEAAAKIRDTLRSADQSPSGGTP